MKSDAARRHQLAALAAELSLRCSDPWVIIGSAAAWLIGADVTVDDIDVMTSPRDASLLLAQWCEQRMAVAASEEDDLFRSRYGRFAFEPLRVEVMGGLDAWDGQGWQPVRVREVVPVDVLGVSVNIPARHEQIRLLRQFGRPKDNLRIAALRHHSPHD